MDQHSYITRITVARLWNLGNFEHYRVEIGADVPEGADAEQTLRGLENILKALRPIPTYLQDNFDQTTQRLIELKAMTPAQWEASQWDGLGAPSTDPDSLKKEIATTEERLAGIKKEYDALNAERSKAMRLTNYLHNAAVWEDTQPESK